MITIIRDKYKVCYVTTLPGTLESFCLQSAIYNINQGEWDVTFISSYDADFEKRLPEIIHYIPLNMPRGMNLTAIQIIPELVRIFRKEKFDLVQYATANAGFYASIASKITGVPIRLYTLWGIGYVHMSGFRRIYKAFLEKVICGCSTHIQPDSKENLQIALEQKLFRPEQGTVIGAGSACGIDLLRYDISRKREWRELIRRKYRISNDAWVLGYVGRLLKDKGIDELLGAAKQMSAKYDNFVLLMVGPLDTVEGIDSEKISWAMNSAQVVFTGQTNEVEKYYAAMDCFTLPSYHEGFGMVTIEAEAMGLPIIDTDIPGSREAMKRDYTGILVEPKDEKSLFYGIEKLYSDNELTKSFGINARQYVEENFEQQELCRLIYENRRQLLENLE